MKNNRKDECDTCHRRKYSVYMAPSGIYLCGRDDCFSVSLSRLYKYLKKTCYSPSDRKYLMDLGIK